MAQALFGFQKFSEMESPSRKVGLLEIWFQLETLQVVAGVMLLLQPLTERCGNRVSSDAAREESRIRYKIFSLVCAHQKNQFRT